MTKLKTFFLAATLATSLVRPTGAQNSNSTPGTVVSWGGQGIPYVAPGTRFTHIAAGGLHNLALRADGTVVAWGDNWHGQSTVPGGLTGVVALAAGDRHSCVTLIPT